MTIKYDSLVLEKLNYNSYLKVPQLLDLQELISDPQHHDEMFFIIIHQASELWFKNILHESDKVVEAFHTPSVSRALKGFKRITAIMDLMVKQINLLSTLTPVEFAGFRDNLNPASGFSKSVQFREIEFKFNVRDAFFLNFLNRNGGQLKSGKFVVCHLFTMNSGNVLPCLGISFQVNL